MAKKKLFHYFYVLGIWRFYIIVMQNNSKSTLYIKNIQTHMYVQTIFINITAKK